MVMTGFSGSLELMWNRFSGFLLWVFFIFGLNELYVHFFCSKGFLEQFCVDSFRFLGLNVSAKLGFLTLI